MMESLKIKMKEWGYKFKSITCDSFIDFFNKFKCWIILIVTIVIISAILIFALYCKGEACGSIINGLFILFTAIVTSLFAIQKYHSEQRTSRLQKLYFEDTLLGQARSIEEMMSQTTKNMLMLENSFNFMVNILDLKPLNIEYVKTYLESTFDSTFNNVEGNINTTDFKKTTISHLFNEAGEKGSALASWINTFEQDAYRFSLFTKSQILKVKPNILRLTEANKEEFKDHLEKIFIKSVQENYVFIKRHYVLFDLFSDIVLKFSEVNYSTMQNILTSFKKEPIKAIFQLINESYKDLVTDFNDKYISNISETDAARIEEKIKCVREKIFKRLYKKSNKSSS